MMRDSTSGVDSTFACRLFESHSLLPKLAIDRCHDGCPEGKSAVYMQCTQCTPLLLEKADWHGPQVHHTQARKSAFKGTALALKSMGRVTRSPKLGQSVAPQNGPWSSKKGCLIYIFISLLTISINPSILQSIHLPLFVSWYGPRLGSWGAGSRCVMNWRIWTQAKSTRMRITSSVTTTQGEYLILIYCSTFFGLSLSKDLYLLITLKLILRE